MHEWLHPAYLLALIAATALAVMTAVAARRLRETPGSTTFAVLMVGVAVWCLGCVVEWLAGTLEGKMLGCRVQYLGIATVPLNWFLVMVRYLRYDAWLTRARLLLLWCIPACTVALLWTNAGHHLMYARIALPPAGALPVLQITYGPWFLVHISYAWALVAAGILLILLAHRTIAPFYRRQTSTLLVIALVPYAVNILYVFRLGPWYGLDLTPVAFVVSALGLLVTMRYFRLIDLSPIARNAVFDHMRDGVIVLDRHRRILDTNPAIHALLGQRVEELYGADAAACFAAWLPAEALEAEGGTSTVQLTDAAGVDHWLNLRVSRIARQEGWLLVLRDITELHHLQERLNALAFYDSVTGLPNRVLANERMLQELARVRRRQTCLAVLYLDVDGFKAVNDTLGHAMGDRLLRDIAERLLACTRACDTVARVGGDEFLLVIADLSNPAFARSTAARILEACAAPFHLDAHTAHLTVSLGIAVTPDDGMDTDTLIRHADHAMYQVKRTGKNAFLHYGEAAAAASGTPPL